VRSTLLPGFVDAKHAALEAGALGVSISGAGPSAFAIVADETVGAEVARAMTEAYGRHEIVATTRVTTVDRDGAITRIA
jgi:homoserine kinase